MVSDGRVLGRALRKVQCEGCGMIRHAVPPDADDVQRLYAGGYDLPRRTGGDDARAESYASELRFAWSHDAPPESILDLGCGSGALLRRLHLDLGARHSVGLDPAADATAPGIEPQIRRGTIADLARGDRFDFIVSVNTIEHVADPAGFLAAIARHLTQGGRAVIVCPSIEPSNDELLFFDHLWTFPPVSIGQLAARAGLSVAAFRPLDGPLAGFALYALSRDAATASLPDRRGTPSVYLQAWSGLEASLAAVLDRQQGPVDGFGAGQMAALVRAYAPVAFARLERLLVDRPEEAWPLGRVARYDPAEQVAGRATLCLVHPRAQAGLAARIRADGRRPVPLPVPDLGVFGVTQEQET